MKSLLSPILSLVVCNVLLFGSTECASSSDIQPSPTVATNNSTSLMSMHGPNTTIVNISSAFVTHTPNASTVHVTTPMPNMTSAYTTLLPNKTTNHTSIISTHSLNSSVFSSMYVTLTSMIMSSSAGNSSIHNSTIHPTPLPTHSINMSSTVAHNASSHILPTMTASPSPVTSVFTTSSVPPTTPAPLPLPKGKYSVTKNGTKCLLLWLSLKLTITYKNNTGNELQTSVVMPSNGTADGICEQGVSSIRISWPYYSFEAYFLTAKAANARWETTNVTFTAQTMNNSDFNNANDTIIQQSVTKMAQLEWLSADLGRSLNCSTDKELKTDSIAATVEGLRLQPFEVHNGDFGEAESCFHTPTSTPKPTNSPAKKTKNKNIVAIAVGCSLAGLVLIVLIGYFIGKRRSRAGPGTGYRKL
ncbi:lysosome-associated membrane glycoprotein 1-like isoform X3 [Actinia tenebrosa]|uniref:Lysosome-associated membrane glycoprotein 5 n=1 Tax=Actinia tenebrosa TaxID=6105 RepID=A0A6P8HQ36_ACTTE|nr:lysosome-associated membrane glycoprotein 1-like isoform X2 [Actinia tenebrosa]XP_031554752.1 lysosome-associated membrane glycoprotein 1-like isoform X3 [Actinia tenebrosa]